ncbi:MAG: molybdenum ABC transporter ATP-binding protein [Sulfurimicrobium sp.]|nr:molybdenum ABC transporter ATP-binding protein [Sulfurimicrobium sp.]MDP1703686.1 molybdenum ABC transporter ATP-binding protein [Sulfurimicrobium sp.]MDP2198217.1 molybdenum ABC transporter ATP-binding protein [Sulfurimicrobium sp.]
MSGITAQFSLPLGGFRLDAEFEAPAQGITSLFGPSGSGKTSLLRCVAGLEAKASGRLTVNGECWQDSERGLFLPPHRRAVGYVFQEAALFPHLSVRGNLEYGWKRVPRQERRQDFDQVADLLGIGPLLDRKPIRLSGGERQRVAMGRALLAAPSLLLMDEPLAALDQASKADILPYLERLHQELAIPVLYVSHSPDEVARLADYLVLLERGRVVASGELHEMLARLDLSLSHGEQAGVVVDTVVGGHDETYHLSWLDFPGGRFAVPQVASPPGHRKRLRVHARDVSLSLEHHSGTSILNIFPVTVSEIAEDTPAKLLVRLDAAGTPLLAGITKKSGAVLGLKPGMPLYAQVKSVALLD